MTPLEPEIPLDRETLDANRQALALPGTVLALDPDEADTLGAFAETALSEAEAWESAFDQDWEVDDG